MWSEANFPPVKTSIKLWIDDTCLERTKQTNNFYQWSRQTPGKEDGKREREIGKHELEVFFLSQNNSVELQGFWDGWVIYYWMKRRLWTLHGNFFCVDDNLMKIMFISYKWIDLAHFNIWFVFQPGAYTETQH